MIKSLIAVVVVAAAFGCASAQAGTHHRKGFFHHRHAFHHFHHRHGYSSGSRGSNFGGRHIGQRYGKQHS